MSDLKPTTDRSTAINSIAHALVSMLIERGARLGEIQLEADKIAEVSIEIADAILKKAPAVDDGRRNRDHRRWYAGMAMQGILANARNSWDTKLEVVTHAFYYADAMLERERQTGEKQENA